MKTKTKILTLFILLFSILATTTPAFALASQKQMNLGSKQYINFCRDGWNSSLSYRPSDRPYSTLQFATNAEFLGWATTNFEWINLNYGDPLSADLVKVNGVVTLDSASNLVVTASHAFYGSVNLPQAIHYLCADLNGDWEYTQLG
jgi:hypothetical protein